MKYSAKDSPFKEIEWVSTGIEALDLIIKKGIPKRRMMEIVGRQSSGKTTLAMVMIAAAQKQGLRCAFADAEGTLDYKYAEQLGIDLSKLITVHANSGEEYADDIEEMFRDDNVDLVVLDSIGGLAPKSMIESDMESSNVGVHAKFVKRFLFHAMEPVRSKNKILICLNHIREDMMKGFGKPSEYSPGGRQMEHDTAVRLRTTMIGRLKDGDIVKGVRIKIQVTKNKVGAPFGIIETDLMFSKGFKTVSNVVEIGLEKGVLHKEGKGHTIYFGETILGVGKAKAETYLEENPTLAAKLKELL